MSEVEKSLWFFWYDYCSAPDNNVSWEAPDIAAWLSQKNPQHFSHLPALPPLPFWRHWAVLWCSVSNAVWKASQSCYSVKTGQNDAGYLLFCYCYLNAASFCGLPQKLVQAIDVSNYRNISWSPEEWLHSGLPVLPWATEPCCRESMVFICWECLSNVSTGIITVYYLFGNSHKGQDQNWALMIGEVRSLPNWITV